MNTQRNYDNQCDCCGCDALSDESLDRINDIRYALARNPEYVNQALAEADEEDCNRLVQALAVGVAEAPRWWVECLIEAFTDSYVRNLIDSPYREEIKDELSALEYLAEVYR